MDRPPLEVADLVRAAGGACIERSRKWITWKHVKVLLAIARCRTAALDGHLDECIRCGGSVTGEHGIGVEKIDFMPKLFTPEDLAMMMRLRVALNPDGRCSPRKMLPTAGACIEPSKAGRRAAM